MGLIMGLKKIFGGNANMPDSGKSHDTVRLSEQRQEQFARISSLNDAWIQADTQYRQALEANEPAYVVEERLVSLQEKKAMLEQEQDILRDLQDLASAQRENSFRQRKYEHHKVHASLPDQSVSAKELFFLDQEKEEAMRKRNMENRVLSTQRQSKMKRYASSLQDKEMNENRVDVDELKKSSGARIKERVTE